MFTLLTEVTQVVQIGFYALGATVAVLTYRSARRGLLNTVRTEYLKRVMDRLAEISSDLAAEFDPGSPNWWPRHQLAKELLDRVHEEYRQVGPEGFARLKRFEVAIGETDAEHRMRVLLARVRTDPFVPAQIRETVVAYLQRRIDGTRHIYWAATTKYCQYLAETRPTVDGLDHHAKWFNAALTEHLNRNELAVEDVERQVDSIRLTIQKYLESFDPHR